MLFKSKSNNKSNMRWLAILAYPIIFFKGILIGRFLNRFRLGGR